MGSSIILTSASLVRNSNDDNKIVENFKSHYWIIVGIWLTGQAHLIASSSHVPRVKSLRLGLEAHLLTLMGMLLA